MAAGGKVMQWERLMLLQGPYAFREWDNAVGIGRVFRR